VAEECWSPLPGAPRCSLGRLHGRGVCPERKFRLFLCAGCRALWDRLPDPATRRAVEVAEQFADAEAFAEDLADARRGAEELCWQLGQERDAAEAASPHARNFESFWRLVCRMYGAQAAAHATNEPGTYFSTGQYHPSDLFQHTRLYGGYFALHQAFTNEALEDTACPALDLLWADLSGGLAQQTPFDPAWRTSDAVALARGIYAERAFDRMPILADALQDAGCTDRVVLLHCRGPFVHVRGCWVVDLVLGKE
jgi:hypothetical protein